MSDNKNPIMNILPTNHIKHNTHICLKSKKRPRTITQKPLTPFLKTLNISAQYIQCFHPKHCTFLTTICRKTFMNTYYGKDSSFSVYFIYGKNIEKGKSTYKKNTRKIPRSRTQPYLHSILDQTKKHRRMAVLFQIYTSFYLKLKLAEPTYITEILSVRKICILRIHTECNTEAA